MDSSELFVSKVGTPDKDLQKAAIRMIRRQNPFGEGSDEGYAVSGDIMSGG